MYGLDFLTINISSGGSRISRWGGDDFQRGWFSVKTYAKTKELDPVGGAHAGGAPLDLPMITKESFQNKPNFF